MKTELLPDAFHAIFPLLSALHNETRDAVNECQAGEGVNECQADDSPPDTGGVAAPSRKRCEATAAAQTGWLGLTKCFRVHFLEKGAFSTTLSALLKEA